MLTSLVNQRENYPEPKPLYGELESILHQNLQTSYFLKNED